MKIKQIEIHNFRSIKSTKFNLNDYSLLIGENNAGKSNVFRALRIFYEDNLKYDEKTDMCFDYLPLTCHHLFVPSYL